jgi:hypothetical protein
MTKVLAGITTSIDGSIAGPNDGPGKGLGEETERRHYAEDSSPFRRRRPARAVRASEREPRATR